MDTDVRRRRCGRQPGRGTARTGRNRYLLAWSLNGPSPHQHLSLAAMILPTNDGFVALNGVAFPRGGETATHYLLGYDAGTEANDEIRGSGMVDTAGFPVPPPLDPTVGENGSGVSVAEEGFVTVHRGRARRHRQRRRHQRHRQPRPSPGRTRLHG
ncbi:MAG: spondin domain-containing protein [Arhodomonas sp.]|nr:spondin domain-containing protein [Arhodomonas sp.]